MSPQPRRVLALMTSPLDGIAHALRVVSALKSFRPELEITWVVRDTFEPLVASFACVDKTIPFYRREGVLAWSALARSLRRETYDYALDLEGHARTGIMTWLSRSQRRVGLAEAKEGATIFYRELLRPPAGGSRHLVDAMLEFARIFGLDPRLRGDIRLREDVPAPPAAWANAAASTRICLFPGRFKRERAWPGMFALAERLAKARPDATVFLLGVEPRAAPPPGLMEANRGRIFDLQGDSGWGQTLRMLQSSDLTISNDNGPAQVASLFGRRNLTLYTMVDPVRRGSYPVGGPANRALLAPGGVAAQISLDAAWEEIEKLLPI